MTPSATVAEAGTAAKSFALAGHAILRGEFPALVLSGDRAILGELPGELTATTFFKFAMEDRRLPAPRDFARSSFMPLPLWPSDRLLPIDGVCFVFSDAEHPAVPQLKQRGGIEHEHYVIADSLLGQDEQRRAMLDAMINDLDRARKLILLGFGDQGARLATRMRHKHRIDAGEIVVIDDNPDSCRRAERAGHVVADHWPISDAAAVVYSPLLRHDRLFDRFVEAQAAGVPVYDNSTPRSGAEHFHGQRQVALDHAAHRALETDGTRLRKRNHELPIDAAMVVREDLRRFGTVELPHLSAGHRAIFHPTQDGFDLSTPGSADRLAVATFGGLRRAFVSLRDRPDLAVFAARSLCANLWPSAVECAFPARCAADLGQTRLEQLLKRHIDGAEVITASQSSAQQVVLGIAANHYASASPIIEIGSALGGSGIIMAAATDQHRPAFYSIDPETATRHIMRWGFEQLQQLDRLHQLIQASDDAALELQHLRGRAGLVFIDGLHTEAATAADFANYAPLVKPGGALLIHDVEPARYSVLRVVIERMLPDARFRPMCMADGLLVLERRREDR